MSPTKRVAVIQWRIQNLAIEENHRKACSYIREAAAQGAELAVLPEYHLTGWSPTSPTYALQAAQSPHYLSAYQSLARELNICIVPGTLIEPGAPTPQEKTEDGPSLHNTAYFISNTGAILGHYRKKNIWHPERPYLISSAESPHPVFDTPLGKVGLLICWDLAFPEAFRELIARGAELVIIPTFWTKYDASPEALTYNPHSEALFLSSTLTARCFENTCGIIFANVSGDADTSTTTSTNIAESEEDDTFLGMSQVVLPIVGPVGTMGRGEGVLVVDMDLGVLRVAEENYKVRADIMREGWYYSYRHNNSST